MVMEDGFYLQLVQFFSETSRVKFLLTQGAYPQELTPVQSRILEFLVFRPPTRLTEVAHCLDFSLSNASREAGKMVQKGFLEKSFDPQDKRITYFSISEHGKKEMGLALERFGHKAAKAFSFLTKGEVSQLISTLNKITGILQKVVER
jgi:DNA-binding MarR family transcriptional regulator